jgi:hypothetical protein
LLLYRGERAVNICKSHFHSSTLGDLSRRGAASDEPRLKFRFDAALVAAAHITGCGRSGTKYTSFALQRLGLDIPHERLGRDGISSWTMAIATEKRPFGPPSSQVSFEQVFHQVRDPIAAIASCMTFNRESWDFISRHIRFPPNAPLLVMAARYWLEWNERAEQVATWRYRVEDLHASALIEICERTNVSCRARLVLSIPRNFNTRREGRAVHIVEELFRRAGLNAPGTVRAYLAKPTTHCPVTWSLLEQADPLLCARIKAKASDYGYRNSDNHDGATIHPQSIEYSVKNI